MKYINLTLHAIKLNDGREFPPSGTIARVAAMFSGFCGDVCSQTFGPVIGLPEPKRGTVFVVSGMVLSAVSAQRYDVVAPATGHPDCVRNEKGQIVSVPGFVR